MIHSDLKAKFNSNEFTLPIKMVSLAESQYLIQLIDKAAEIDSKLLGYIRRTHRVILDLSGDDNASDSVDTVIQILENNEAEFSESFFSILDEIKSYVESHPGLRFLNCILNELTNHASDRTATLREFILDLTENSIEVISHNMLAIILDRIVSDIQSIDSDIGISLFRMRAALGSADE